MFTSSQYDAFIKSESARFSACLRAADPAAVVLTCPDWTTLDLLWHLTEVQRFWTAIVVERLQSPDSVFADRRSGPGPDEDPYDLFDESTVDLLDSLQTDDAVQVWSWASDQSVGFVRRRQAHEALIHRVDAESIAADFTPLDNSLASDGVDEFLTVMHGAATGGDFKSDGLICEVRATDTGNSWRVGFGAKDGADAFASIPIEGAREPDLILSQSAEILDRFLWNRGRGEALDVNGDAALLERLTAILALAGN